MAAQIRRIAVPALLVLFFVSLAVLAGSARQAQTGRGQGRGAGAGAAPRPAQAGPRTPSPEQQALTAARAIREPAARLAALEKIRTDFPEASSLASVDTQILSTLAASFEDRTDAITAVFDRIIARIPAEAAPETRLTATVSPINVVVTKKLLLDRSETLLTATLGALDPEKFAQTQRDNAKRANRAEPTAAQIETTLGQQRSRGLEALAKVYVAKGDTARAEETYKECVKANPAFGTAVTSLVNLYTAKNDYASAEAVLKESVTASRTPAAASRPQLALADLYIKKGDEASAEALLKDVVKTNATLATALVSLARLENKRGDATAALDHYMTAALGRSLNAADEAAMKSLYAKAHNGSEAGLEEALDTAYHEKFPNPVTPEVYKPTPNRTNKLVLLEMFTGSGCPPCVSADLALDAAMIRYGDAVISLAYHQNIPQPDPMVAANNNDRRLYYSVSGVPTFEIDGGLGQVGGGARTATPGTYNAYIKKIDAALETPARAALSVAATGEGDTISVTVNVSSFPADAKDVRLHIVLAEKELKFTGENGIRFHPMSVRASVGDKGAGLPISATGTTKVTFDINTIKDEVTKTLAAEIEKRRKAEAPGATPREFAAEGHAYTAIDTSELVVVAFLQEGAYQPPPPAPRPAAAPEGAAGSALAQQALAARADQKTPATPAPSLANILQAAKTDVVFAAVPKGKGGGR